MQDATNVPARMADLIARFDWATTPLGAMERWPQSLRTAVDILLGSGHAMQLAWGPERTVLYNDAYAPMLGDRHPGALGCPFRQAWPEVWDQIAPLVSRVFAGETVNLKDLPLVMTRHGYPEDTWWSFSYSPIRDEGGGIAGLLNVPVDATVRMRAERERDDANTRLQHNEARFRALVTASTNSVYRMSPDWRLMYALDSQTLANTSGPIEDWVDKYILAEDRPRVSAAIAAAIRTRSLFELEHRVRLADGSVGWVLSRAVPLLDPDGRIREWFGAGSDVTQRRTIVEKLHQSEQRYRSLFENMDQGYLLADVIFDAAGRAIDIAYVESNPAAVKLVGIDLTGKRLSQVERDYEPSWYELWGRVATSGEGARQQRYVAAEGRWYDFYVFKPEPDDRASRRVAVLFQDVTERKREEQGQAFLLQLSDTLRAENGVEAVGNRAVQMIAAQLGLDRVYLVALDPDVDNIVVTHETRRADMPPMLGSYRGSSFPTAIKEIFERTIVYDDVRTDPRLTELDRLSFAGLGAVGFAAVPIRRGTETMIWAAGAVSVRPRAWTAAEVALLEHAVERTWAAVERARAERALRESEGRFRQFAAASSGALWIRSADTLAMEYVSPAITTIYGVAMETFLGDMKRWAALIVPEDRDVALAHIERARTGESVTHEFRIQRPSDRAFRWIRNVDFPLRDEQGRIQRVGGIAEDVTEAKLAVQHQGVLLLELQHRVRNIMAIIRSITARTAQSAADVPDYAARMAGRLLALARVQALLTRAANVKVGIRSIVQDEVGAQAHHDGQYVLQGPDVALSPKAAEVLTLAVHELSTNALKHGALSVPGGRVRVAWETAERGGVPWLVFDWTETGAPAQPAPESGRPRRAGFGSELIEGRIPYELRGRGRLVIEPGGARCQLEFPLKGGASVLETGAPQQATVFGGALDMAGSADLRGYRVLVVEDDYYLATDAARALRGAGAEVLGPAATEDAARAVLLEQERRQQRPHAVLLDINLGPGPSFGLAGTLLGAGIPFVFATGYDQEAIPPEFAGVERLEKPVPLRQIVSAIERIVKPA